MTSSCEPIAWAGLGRMGSPMCARLADAGFAVRATDTRPALAQEAGSIGARWAPSLAQAASGAQLLITMLPGPDEVASVIEHALGSLAPGACWLEMSTASPRVGLAIADAAR